jgi:nucleotide-binding universal stress UspA family protein
MAAIIPTVRHLVSGTGAVVHLLVVRPPLRELADRGGSLVHLDEILRQELAAWHDYLTRQGSQLAYDGIVVEREVRFGDALVETLAVAQRHATHLIALAAQPQRWLQRFRRPHLAQQLLTHAVIPVLAVPPEKAPL